MTGEPGVGLVTVAKQAVASLKGTVEIVLPEKDEKVDIEKGTITVQSIRRLYDSTKTVSPSGRIIIIDYAERMGVPAQNAFLKLLEEPPANTRFMLLTHQPSSLLPTISSRSQQVIVKPISHEQSQALLNELKVTDTTKRSQLLFIAEGLPAELTRLVADDAYFTQRAQIVKDAREYITSTAYTRLILANKYKNNREAALILINDASRMLQKTLANGGNEATILTVERLVKLHKRLSEQGNVRLQLSSALVL